MEQQHDYYVETSAGAPNRKGPMDYKAAASYAASILRRMRKDEDLDRDAWLERQNVTIWHGPYVIAEFLRTGKIVTTKDRGLSKPEYFRAAMEKAWNSSAPGYGVLVHVPADAESWGDVTDTEALLFHSITKTALLNLGVETSPDRGTPVSKIVHDAAWWLMIERELYEGLDLFAPNLEIEEAISALPREVVEGISARLEYRIESYLIDTEPTDYLFYQIMWEKQGDRDRKNYSDEQYQRDAGTIRAVRRCCVPLIMDTMMQTVEKKSPHLHDYAHLLFAKVTAHKNEGFVYHVDDRSYLSMRGAVHAYERQPSALEFDLIPYRYIRAMPILLRVHAEFHGIERTSPLVDRHALPADMFREIGRIAETIGYSPEDAERFVDCSLFRYYNMYIDRISWPEWRKSDPRPIDPTLIP